MTSENHDEDSERASGESIPQIDLQSVENAVGASSRLDPSQHSPPRFRLVREFGRQGSDALSQPLCLSLDGDTHVIAVDRPEQGEFRVRRFALEADESPDALFQLTRGNTESQVMDIAAVAVHEQEIYLVDPVEGEIKRFSRDGRWLDTYSSDGPEGEPFSNPRDVAIDGQGCVLVADTNNDRAVRLRPDGESSWVISEFSQDPSDESDELYEPASLCVAHQGGTWVADSNQNRIVRFDEKRQPVAFLEGDDLLTFPTRVRESSDGRQLYVADRGNSRVQRFDQSGQRTGTLSLGGSSGDGESGLDLAVDRRGHVVLFNVLRESIVVLDFQET